jgi:hypothetical protein
MALTPAILPSAQADDELGIHKSIYASGRLFQRQRESQGFPLPLLRLIFLRLPSGETDEGNARQNQSTVYI